MPDLPDLRWSRLVLRLRAEGPLAWSRTAEEIAREVARPVRAEGPVHVFAGALHARLGELMAARDRARPYAPRLADLLHHRPGPAESPLSPGENLPPLLALRLPRRAGADVAPGERFDVEAVLVGPDAMALGEEVAALVAEAGRAGVGRVDAPGRFRLVHAERAAYGPDPRNAERRLAVLAQEPVPARGAVLRFESPLVQAERRPPAGWAAWWASDPARGPFVPAAPLLEAAMRRVARLAESQGGEPRPLAIPDGLAEVAVHARHVASESWGLHLVRGGPRPMVATGWTGDLALVGDLRAAWPWLRAGAELGIGKRTSLGLGAYALYPLETEADVARALRGATAITA